MLNFVSLKPPQRWIHAIEHGAAAFLFNPCANGAEIEAFKNISKRCLRRHIITPYENLPENVHFAIVTFGCRVEMNKVIDNEEIIKSYLRRHAIQDGPEYPLNEDGEYKFGLLQKAKIISDIDDSKICPDL